MNFQITKKGKKIINAFTIVELVVVIMIIGILSAVAVPSFRNATYKTRQKEATLLLSSYLRSAQAYYVEFGSITQNTSELGHFMKITGCCSVCGWDHNPKYCQSNSPMNFDNRELVSWRTNNGLYTMAMHPQSDDLIYFIAYPEHEMGFQGYGVAACFSGKYGITKIKENNNNQEKITHPPGCGENNDDWVHP